MLAGDSLDSIRREIVTEVCNEFGLNVNKFLPDNSTKFQVLRDGADVIRGMTGAGYKFDIQRDAAGLIRSFTVSPK